MKEIVAKVLEMKTINSPKGIQLKCESNAGQTFNLTVWQKGGETWPFAPGKHFTAMIEEDNWTDKHGNTHNGFKSFLSSVHIVGQEIVTDDIDTGSPENAVTAPPLQSDSKPAPDVWEKKDRRIARQSAIKQGNETIAMWLGQTPILQYDEDGKVVPREFYGEDTLSGLVMKVAEHYLEFIYADEKKDEEIMAEAITEASQVFQGSRNDPDDIFDEASHGGTYPD